MTLKTEKTTAGLILRDMNRIMTVEKK